MSEVIRCKFNINSVRDVGSAIRVEMGAVYSSDPKNENKSFSTSTPCAFFSMDISKSAAASKSDWLNPGAQVYVDITLADIPEWNWMFDRYPELGRTISVRFLNTDDTVSGKFKRQKDEEFLRVSNNNTEFPVIVQEDGTVVKLYNSDRTYRELYWKYVD